MVPLSGLQLLCCAAVVGLGLHFSLSLSRPDSTADLAVKALEVARQSESAVDAALEVAAASLSSTIIIVQRNDTLDQIFRRLELSLTDLANIRALKEARSALDRLRPGDQLTFARRDGELVGLERTISLNQTLKVQRAEDDSFVASV